MYVESDPKGVVCKGQPALLEACDNGIKWLCLNWQLPYAWPELPNLVQSALNMHSRQQQGDIEVLLEIGRLQKAAIDKGCSPYFGLPPQRLPCPMHLLVHQRAGPGMLFHNPVMSPRSAASPAERGDITGL